MKKDQIIGNLQKQIEEMSVEIAKIKDECEAWKRLYSEQMGRRDAYEHLEKLFNSLVDRLGSVAGGSENLPCTK